MPFLLGAFLTGVGALLVLRMLGREWDRVNADLDDQRARQNRPMNAKNGKARAEIDLERDPQTGVYRAPD